MRRSPSIHTFDTSDSPCDEEVLMSLFMDVHSIEGGVSVADVADAHVKDLATQAKYGVSYLRYWVDEGAGKIFCLVEADSADDASTVHREAHGLVADEIYAVSEHS
jgi:peptidyl-tRNA hydrolase